MRKFILPLGKKGGALICVGVVLNLMGRSISTAYSLPLFLDNIGTFFISIVLGPIAGIVTGILCNFLTAIVIPGDWRYALVSAGGALVVGKLLYNRKRISSFRVVATSVLTGLVAVLLATPINMVFRSGYTGNEWGDALVEMTLEHLPRVLPCCIAGEIIVNIPDKILSVLLVMGAIVLFRKTGYFLADEIEKEEQSDYKKAKGIKPLLSVFVVIGVIAASLLGAVASNAATGDTLVQNDIKVEDFKANYAFTTYDTEDGLKSAEINTITQTSDGYIWAGTYSGLYRYDGTEFKKVELDKRITSVIRLCCDRQGRMWIGTNESGVACYDPYSQDIRFYTTDDGLSSNSIKDICEDEQGYMYVSTSSYLCRIELENAKDDTNALEPAEIKVYSDLPEITYVSSLTTLGNGEICGISGDGMLFVMKNEQLAYTKECTQKECDYSAVAFNEDDVLLVGTTASQMEKVAISASGLKTQSTVDLQGLSCVNAICYESDFAGYFIACENGFGYVGEDGSYQELTIDGFDTAISDIIIDRQNDIWFSSSKQGIMKVSYNPFTDLFAKEQIDREAVNAVLNDDGILYIGTDDGVVKMNADSDEGISSELLEQLDGMRVRHILKDSKGNYWFSTYGEDGLVRISKSGKIKKFTEAKTGILGGRFRFSMELSDGRILAASSDGISFLKGNQVVKTIGEEEMSVPKVLFALEQEDGSILAATDGGGVYLIEDDEVVDHIGEEQGLYSQVVMKIVPCTGGYIFVASNGLYYYKEDKSVIQLENFPYSNNYDIYIAQDGKAFISSSAGIYVTTEKELLQDEEAYNYTLLDANRGFDTTLTANAWDAVQDETLYLCCTDGLRSLNMEQYEDFNNHYQIVIVYVEKEGKAVEAKNGIYNIPAGSGEVTVTAAVLNYAISDPLVYLELEGVDESGRYVRQSELSTIYYSNLPFGNYSFDVKVYNDSGTKVLKEMSFVFRKEAKLYERTYFKVYLICALAVMLMFVVWLGAKMSNLAVINKQYEQIQRAEDEVQEANEEKARFMDHMTQEIKSPILDVLVKNEQILRLTKSPDVLTNANSIQKSATSLLNMINDFFAMAELETGRMESLQEEYDLALVLEEAIGHVKQDGLKKGIRIEIEVGSYLPRRLYGDGIHLTQVIKKLLENAIKYTKEGSIGIKVEGEREEEQLHLHVVVEDTGVGIREEELEKILNENIKSTNYEKSSIDIRLATHLLELMGSKLEIQSIYGEGSRFCFDLMQKIVDVRPMGDFEEAAKTSEQKGAITYEGEDEGE
ncbi:two-component regulator propeller domain-containing protein [Eubacterium oxidoreducens]|nr:two-component regulator propeller domain-containing protein [Eubacterium oxidoreducens]